MITSKTVTYPGSKRIASLAKMNQKRKNSQSHLLI